MTGKIFRSRKWIAANPEGGGEAEPESVLLATGPRDNMCAGRTRTKTAL